MRKFETVTTKVVAFDTYTSIYDVEDFVFTEDFDEPLTVKQIYLNSSDTYGTNLIGKTVNVTLWQADDLVPMITSVVE